MLSMVSQSFGVPIMTFNSIDSTPSSWNIARLVYVSIMRTLGQWQVLSIPPPYLRVHRQSKTVLLVIHRFFLLVLTWSTNVNYILAKASLFVPAQGETSVDKA